MAMKKVLIIEFNTSDAGLLADTLRDAGYLPLLAATGAEGARLLLDEYPDLVVLNLLMPDLQGAELIRRVRARDRKVPIIAINQLTAASPFLIHRMGANDQITKPIEPARFLEMAERLIGKAVAGNGGETPSRAAPRKAPDEGIPSEGNFKQMGFHLLLGRIFRLQAGGVLSVRDEFGEIEISFQSGLPVFVDSEGFARRLVRDKRIDGESAREARNLALRDGITEQEAIGRLNLLTPAEMRDAVRGFGYSVLRDLCRPSGTRFSWLAQPVADGEPLDPAVIIELAAKRHFSPEKITDSLEGKGRALRAMYLGDDPGRLPDLDKRPMLQKAVDAARRHRILSDVLSQTDVEQEKISWAVYALGILKVITFNAAEQWQAPAEAPASKQPTVKSATVPAAPVAPAAPVEVTVEIPEAEEATGGPISDKQLLRLGRQLLKSKTYSKAQKCFEEVLVRHGDDKNVLLYFAQAASRNRFADAQDRLFDSVDALRRILAADASHVEARLELSRIFNEAGESELAMVELEKARDLDPGNADIQREMRNHLRRVEHLDGADSTS